MDPIGSSAAKFNYGGVPMPAGDGNTGTGQSGDVLVAYS